MRRIDLVGKSREQIDEITADMRPAKLRDLLFLYASVEPFFSPETIAKHRGMSKRAIVQRMKEGVIRAHKPLENGWRAPLSAILEWDEQTAVKLPPQS